MMQRQGRRLDNEVVLFICEYHNNLFCIYFSARNIKPSQPPVPPPLPPSPIPLFTPGEIQLGKKDAPQADQKNSANKQEANPYRKAANGRD